MGWAALQWPLLTPLTTVAVASCMTASATDTVPLLSAETALVLSSYGELPSPSMSLRDMRTVSDASTATINSKERNLQSLHLLFMYCLPIL